MPLLGRLAGSLSDAGHFERLVEDGIEAAARGDEGAFLDLDRGFHLGLLAAAGNPRVVDVVDAVLDQLRLAPFHNALDDVAQGHAQILTALLAGDREATEAAAREHLELTRTAWS